MVISALQRFFHPSPLTAQAHEIYANIVAQARQPVFYQEWHVPDTLDGRFDIIVVHMFLALQAREDKEFVRALQELFFADMDRSLREMGVGDMGVGKRVKAMAQAFYGRLKIYGETIHDEKLLAEALRRNVWREAPIGDEALQLAAYMRQHSKA